MRLHARLYPGGEGPSKVNVALPLSRRGIMKKPTSNVSAVLAQLHKEKVHGQEPVGIPGGCILFHEIQRSNEPFLTRSSRLSTYKSDSSATQNQLSTDLTHCLLINSGRWLSSSSNCSLGGRRGKRPLRVL